MNNNELTVLRAALGIQKQGNQATQNYYMSEPGHVRHIDVLSLVASGHMEMFELIGNSLSVYACTEEGREAAMEWL